MYQSKFECTNGNENGSKRPLCLSSVKFIWHTQKVSIATALISTGMNMGPPTETSHLEP